MAGLLYKYREVLWSSLIGFLAGFYASAFHISNNMTMLTAPSIVLMFFCFTIPPIVLIAAVAFSLKAFGKSNYSATVSVALSLIYLLLVLRPALLEIDSINFLLSLVRIDSGSVIDTSLYVVLSSIPAVVVAFIFRDNSKMFAIILGTMIVAIFGMKVGTHVLSSNVTPETGKNWANWVKYKDISLEKKPNIFFIISDAYSSLAFIYEQKIDITSFRQFLTDHNFSLYEEVFSSYQQTLNSVPVILNMEHHYYSISVSVDFAEVENSARIISGGDNNFFHILNSNGYRTHNIHQGTYLLLQGSNADYSYPKIGTYVGFKSVFGSIFKRDFLTKKDKSSANFSVEKVYDEAITHIPDDKSTSSIQYIHLWGPNHSQRELDGKCDEQKELEKYAGRIKETNVILKKLLASIIDKDPDAVIILIGDHGAYIKNKCQRYDTITTLEQLRDRIGILCAIRWPISYDGRYDSKIKTSVNLLRYVLASLAKNETAILNTTVPDDGYVVMYNYRSGHRFFKIVEDGNMMAQPISLNDL